MEGRGVYNQMYYYKEYLYEVERGNVHLPINYLYGSYLELERIFSKYIMRHILHKTKRILWDTLAGGYLWVQLQLLECIWMTSQPNGSWGGSISSQIIIGSR